MKNTWNWDTKVYWGPDSSCGRGFQKAKVFKLESVDHREPSQKLKFIEITVFGLLVVVFFFFLQGVGDVLFWPLCDLQDPLPSIEPWAQQ